MCFHSVIDVVLTDDVIVEYANAPMMYEPI